MDLSDRCNVSKLCWYSISTRSLVEEKQNTDQADWPLIEGMSLWLCGMKCDWLKGGNHSLGRQSCVAECHFTWLIFLDLHAFKVNWFLIHPVLVQPRNTGHLFQVWCSLALLLASAHHCTAVKLIGPQMAGFGSAHHMPLYIMSFALLESPEGDVYNVHEPGGKWSVLKWDGGTAQSFYCLLRWNIVLYLIFHFKVNEAVNGS